MSETYVRAIEGSIGLKQRDKTYVDLSLSFKPSPVTKDITVIRNEVAINNSIKNIIMITPLEVPFNADMGSTTQDFLFDVMDEVTEGFLVDEIKRAILFNEPRVTFKPPSETDAALYELYYSQTPRSIGDLTFQGDLGVWVDADPDQLSLEVTVKYRIVGGAKIFRVQEILTPTR